jgi:glucose/arabinose dehydrogenase
LDKEKNKPMQQARQRTGAHDGRLWRLGLGLLWGGPVIASLYLMLAWLPSPQARAAQPPFELAVEEVASGFVTPIKISNAGDDRLFVVERQGLIQILLPDGTRLPEPFLNLTDRILSNNNEQGLLGLVFEPQDPTTFYVNYTRNSANSDDQGDTVIARFRVSTTNANQADPESEEIILVVDQPYPNHNAGDLAFGPDGYLYIPLGDGGSGGDPQNRAQNLNELLGKVLRIDVVGEQTYTIPPDNPYADDNNPNTRAEIWSLGWRNPWRFSFDRETGEMYIGDVGQSNWEEIDYEPANTPGRNYGWNRCEGRHVYPPQEPPQPCTDDTFINPIFDYARSDGVAVTGGFVYRGEDYPKLVGHYLFADFATGNFWSLLRTGNSWTVTPYGNIGVSNPTSFGEDHAGELYVANYDGTIFRIVDNSPPQETETPTPTNTLVRVTPESLTPQSYLPLITGSE